MESCQLLQAHTDCTFRRCLLELCRGSSNTSLGKKYPLMIIIIMIQTSKKEVIIITKKYYRQPPLLYLNII